MRKLIILLIILFYFPVNYSHTNDKKLVESVLSEAQELYKEMELDGKINYSVFEQAMIGYKKIHAKNKNIITLIDFSKPSTKKRFYVLDLKHKEVVYTTYVAHGRNSGGNYATSFSNENGSNKSSLGFFVTENTYEGKHGYSLIINGLEEGINDKAKERAIVIHSAGYANPSVISSSGRLGRSFGCPALPEDISTPIIDTIKNGTLLFIYANDEGYLEKSAIL